MNILVCVSRVPDTAARINIGSDNKTIDTQGVKFILNPYDEFAIAVYRQNYKLGYIPLNENKPLFGMMNTGIELRAEIAEVDEEAYEWVKMRVLM